MASRNALAASSKRPLQSGQPALNTTGTTRFIPAKAAAAVISPAPGAGDSLTGLAPPSLDVHLRGAAAGGGSLLSCTPAVGRVLAAPRPARRKVVGSKRLA